MQALFHYAKLRIANIHSEDKKILKSLGLWEVNPPEVWQAKARPPPTGQPISIEYPYRLFRFSGPSL
jgi:hypothetical protein